MKKVNLEKVITLLLVLTVLLSIINVIMIQIRIQKVEEAKELLKEKMKPAQLNIIKLTASSCDDCYDIEEAIASLKKQNVNITKEESFELGSVKAQELITQYNVQKLPTLIISGEINKSEQLRGYLKNVGEEVQESIVYTNINPPYYNIALKRVVGRVSIVNVVDSQCEECTSLSDIPKSLESAGIFIKDERSVEYDSEEGSKLIKDFDIKQIPALLISNEIDYYESFKQQMLLLNLTEKDGFYAMHSIFPPYRDLDQNKIVGLVDIILLTDESCTACYNVSVNRLVLNRFGMAIESEKLYDIQSREGINIKNKYNITKIPILILSPEANVYSSFVNAWEDVGNVEEDDWHVMRNPEVLGTYRDLETNEIVEIE